MPTMAEKLKKIPMPKKPWIVGLILGGMALVSNVSAAINWTDITDILDGVATYLFPSLISLITAAVPIIIVVTVVGFIVGFLDKILDLLKMR